MEVGAPFVSQADARSGQRTERGWYCEVEQQLKKIEKELRYGHRRLPRSVNALRLGDEAFSHTPETGDDHEGDTADAPAHIAAAAFEVPACDAQASDCNHGSDDVAAPVHDVENGAFYCRRLLTLDRFVERWSGSKVLRACGERSDKVSQEDEA